MTKEDLNFIIEAVAKSLSDKDTNKRFKGFKTIKDRTEFLSDWLPRILTRVLDSARKNGLLNVTKELGLSYKVENKSFKLTFKGNVIYDTKTDPFNNQDEFKDFVLEFFKSFIEALAELIEKMSKGEKTEDKMILEEILNKDKTESESPKARYNRIIKNLVKVKKIKVSLIKAILLEITINFSDDMWEGEFDTLNPLIEKGKFILRNGKPVYKRKGGLQNAMVTFGAKIDGESLNIEYMNKDAFLKHMGKLLIDEIVKIPKTEQDITVEHDILRQEISNLENKVIKSFNARRLTVQHPNQQSRADLILEFIDFLYQNMEPNLARFLANYKIISDSKYHSASIQLIKPNSEVIVSVKIKNVNIYTYYKLAECKMENKKIDGILTCEVFNQDIISLERKDIIGQLPARLNSESFYYLIIAIQEAIIKIMNEAVESYIKSEMGESIGKRSNLLFL